MKQTENNYIFKQYILILSTNIRDLRDKTIADKLTSTMMIHIITPSVDYNLWLKRLDNKLNEPTNQNLLKVPKVVKPKNNKTSL